MSKKIVIKLTKSGPKSGPFKLTTNTNQVLAESVSKKDLIKGLVFVVDDYITGVTLESVGNCSFKKLFKLDSYVLYEYATKQYEEVRTGCVWRHLTDTKLYNSFYGEIHPYVIEYPFAYQMQDEIIQNVKDYTRSYNYLPIPDGVFNDNARVEVDNQWFNKAIVYNGQQSSGLLHLVPKPKNNLQAYGQYPKFLTDGKIITYTKSDNFYQYNTFWALQKSPYVPLFNTSCESLSVDKVINTDNMDYSTRSFKKAPLRAKDVRVRHILDNSCTTHLVSQFILSPSQKSYK